MPAIKGKYFTIGQFAALHGVNKKTLMWYDEIGLFSPAAVNSENGYRLYSHLQSVELETILMLRDLGVPIPDIQHFMSGKSVESMEKLLTAHITVLDERIRSLKALRSRLGEYRKDMRAILELDLDAIVTLELPSQYVALVPTTPELSFDDELALVTGKVAEFHLPRLYQASVGSMLPVENIYAHQFDGYTNIFISVPDPKRKKGLHRLPSGRYLRAFCKGSWEKLPSRYEDILAFAETHGLRLTGFAYETGMNDLVIDDMEEYITRIEIPVL